MRLQFKHIAIVFLLYASNLFGQAIVTISPVPELQFFDASGRTLAFGCVFSYSSQTTNPIPTYTDFTGVTPHTNPIILDAGGRAQVWLEAGIAYSLKVVSAGGTNCALGTTQYTVDGIAGGGSTNTTVVVYVPAPTFIVTSQNQLFQITLTGNASSNPLSAPGIVPPGLITFEITQDNVGNHTFGWPANSIGGATICPAANCMTTQHFVWDGVNAVAVGPATYGNGPAIATGDITATGNVIITGTLHTVGAATFDSTATGPAWISSCVNPAAVGALRLCKTDALNWRNNANSADQGLSQDTSDRLLIGQVGGVVTTGTIPDIFLGGVTAAFPRLKRNATAINFRLGDDSADAPITASTLGVSGIITSTATGYQLGGSELASPASPTAGLQKGYFKANAGFCSKDSAGVEYCPVVNNGGSSTGTTGYIWLGPILLQWAKGTGVVDDSSQTVSFAISFPHAIDSAVVSNFATGGDTGETGVWAVTAQSTSGATVMFARNADHNGNTNYPVVWAVGH